MFHIMLFPVMVSLITEGTLMSRICDCQQYGTLTRVDSDEPVQPPFMLRNFEWCSAGSLTLIEYS